MFLKYRNVVVSRKAEVLSTYWTHLYNKIEECQRDVSAPQPNVKDRFPSM